MDCKREFSQQWFLNRKNHNSFHCGSIYFQNLKSEIEEKLLLNPPMKINLPGLRVMRKCKVEISAAIKEIHIGPERPAFGPLACTDPLEGVPTAVR